VGLEARTSTETQPVMSKGDRRQAVQQSIPAYDKGVTLPMWAAQLILEGN